MSEAYNYICVARQERLRRAKRAIKRAMTDMDPSACIWLDHALEYVRFAELHVEADRATHERVDRESEQK